MIPTYQPLGPADELAFLVRLLADPEGWILLRDRLDGFSPTRLLDAGVIAVVGKTETHTGYRIVDRPAVEKRRDDLLKEIFPGRWKGGEK